MIVKWIVCEVDIDKKQAFSEAQEQWAEIKDTRGFLAQVGGWDVDNPHTACIIAFWESTGDLDSFMKNLHGRIFKVNDQQATYKSINVSYFDAKTEMPGSTNSLSEAARHGRLLRIANCMVRPARTTHFEKVQQDIWLPGMQKSKGMLGGVFSGNTVQDNRYLVSTFWESAGDHREYVRLKLPDFQKKADIKSDLLEITGRKVRLKESWSVIR
jgi:heme-degrading monooxygenase HmoA